MDHALDQTVLGDAGEAMGRVRTGDGGGDPSGNGAAVAVPINFKELVVLTRRGGSFCILFFQWLLTDSCVCHVPSIYHAHPAKNASFDNILEVVVCSFFVRPVAPKRAAARALCMRDKRCRILLRMNV